MEEEEIIFSRFIGWHGTDERNEENIRREGFKLGELTDEWLGEGIYFFTEGIGDPNAHAQNWVRSEAYRRGSTRYVVLKVSIVVLKDVVLDLRYSAGKNLFASYRQKVIDTFRQRKKKFGEDFKYRDGATIRHMKGKLGIEVVIAEMCVQFLQDRREGLYSRIPNCTFLYVSNCEENIDRERIEAIDRGNI